MRSPALRLAALALLVAALLAAWLLRRDGGAPAPEAQPAGSPGAAQAASPSAAGAAPLPALPEAATSPAPRGAFEGRVLSTRNGAGIAGAEVTFSRGGAAASARSGADGAFRFEPPEPGRWQLAAASGPGHAPFAPEWGHSPVVLDARPGETVRGVSLWLDPVRPVAGRVVDPEDRPVQGAEVRVLGAAAGTRALMPSTDRAVSAADGSFSIAAPAGATLEGRHPGHAPGRAEVEPPARAPRVLVLRLGAAGARTGAGSITGKVVAPGAPVEGALVSARLLLRGGPGSAEGLVSAQALSDAEGRFTLGDLEPGRYLLLASRDGLTQSRAVVARTGEEATVELSRGGRLAGVVRESGTGKPVAPFRVEVRRGGRGWRLPVRVATVVDPSGRFELADLPPGPVSVVVSAPGHLPSGDVDATVPEEGAGAELEIALATGGRVRGRVTDRDGGKPIAGAQVALEGDGGAPGLLDAGAAAFTGGDGTFQLGGLPARTVTLHVSAEGHHGRIVTGVEVPERGEGGPVEVRLSPVAEGEDPRVELAGIGAGLERRGRAALRITFVAPGGGAAEAGLLPGDEILSVEGKPIADLGLDGAVELIRGPEDTRVRLVVRRGEGAPSEIWVWRRLVRG